MIRVIISRQPLLYAVVSLQDCTEFLSQHDKGMPVALLNSCNDSIPQQVNWKKQEIRTDIGRTESGASVCDANMGVQSKGQ